MSHTTLLPRMQPVFSQALKLGGGNLRPDFRQKPSSSFPNYYINYSMLKSGGWRLIILLIQIHI